MGGFGGWDPIKDVKRAAEQTVNAYTQVATLGQAGYEDGKFSQESGLAQPDNETSAMGQLGAIGKAARDKKTAEITERAAGIRAADDEIRNRTRGGRASTVLFGGATSGGTALTAGQSVARRTLLGA